MLKAFLNRTIYPEFKHQVLHPSLKTSKPHETAAQVTSNISTLNRAYSVPKNTKLLYVAVFLCGSDISSETLLPIDRQTHN